MRKQIELGMRENTEKCNHHGVLGLSQRAWQSRIKAQQSKDVSN